MKRRSNPASLALFGGSKRPHSELIALSLLSAAEVAHSFSAFMPSAFTIKNWVLEGTNGELEERLVNLRAGYKPAVFFGLAISGTVALLAHSPLPILAGLGAGLVMMSQYEAALPPELRVPMYALPNLILPGLALPAPALEV